jgi:hypothetical protein
MVKRTVIDYIHCKNHESLGDVSYITVYSSSCGGVELSC